MYDDIRAAMKALPPTIGFRVGADGAVSAVITPKGIETMNATEAAMDTLDRTQVERTYLDPAEITPGYYWADGPSIYDPKKLVRTITHVTGKEPWLAVHAYHGAVLSEVTSLRFIARIREPSGKFAILGGSPAPASALDELEAGVKEQTC